MKRVVGIAHEAAGVAARASKCPFHAGRMADEATAMLLQRGPHEVVSEAALKATGSVPKHKIDMRGDFAVRRDVSDSLGNVFAPIAEDIHAAAQDLLKRPVDDWFKEFFVPPARQHDVGDYGERVSKFA